MLQPTKTCQRNTLTFSIAGGSDAARFVIDAATGVLSFIAAPDYETPSDANADNIYDVIVQVADGLGGLDSQQIAIRIVNANELPTSSNATILGTEDVTYTFAPTDFPFVDLDAGDSLSAVRIDSLPTAGMLTLGGTAVAAGQVITQAQIAAGALVFAPAPDGNGSPYASLTFSVADSAGGFALAPSTLTLNIAPVNDAPTLLANTGATFNEGATGVLLAGQLALADVDNTAAQLSFTLRALPANGSLQLNGAALALGASFTQADLNAGLITYVHDGSETLTDSFGVDFTDGALGGTSVVFSIAINPINDAPVLTSAQIVVQQGAMTVLDPALIAASDPDSPLASLSFIVGSVTAGYFDHAANPGVAITSFTPGELAAGQIRFIHDGSDAAPAIDLSVSDGSAASPAQRPAVTFVPLPTKPQTQPNSTTPVTPESPAADPLPTETVADEATDTPSDTATDTPSDTPATALADDFGTDINGDSGRPAADGSGQSVAQIQRRLLGSPALRHTGFATTIPRSVPVVSNNDVTEGALVNALRSQWLALREAGSLNGHESVGGIGGVTDGDDRGAATVATVSVQLAGVAFSVGLIWWVSRLGSLVGTLIASTPAWKQVDPLPVLGPGEEAFEPTSEGESSGGARAAKAAALPSVRASRMLELRSAT